MHLVTKLEINMRKLLVLHNRILQSIKEIWNISEYSMYHISFWKGFVIGALIWNLLLDWFFYFS